MHLIITLGSTLANCRINAMRVLALGMITFSISHCSIEDSSIVETKLKNNASMQQQVPVFLNQNRFIFTVDTTSRESTLESFLLESEKYTDIHLTSNQLEFLRKTETPIGSSTRYQQIFNTMPVGGTEVVMIYDAQNNLQAINAALASPVFLQNLNIDFSKDAALQSAEIEFGDQNLTLIADKTAYTYLSHTYVFGRVLTVKSASIDRVVDLFVFKTTQGDLKVLTAHDQAKAQDVKLPAIAGSRISIYANVSNAQCSSMEIGKFIASDNQLFISQPVVDLMPPGEDPQIVDVAFDHFHKTLNYYKDQFKRDSYDGNGAPVKVSLNCIGLLEMIFGNALYDSSSEAFKFPAVLPVMGARNFIFGLDIVGHEFTHAVIESTSNLVYRGESGALNEHLADFFGETIQQLNEQVKIPYAIGESVLVTAPLFGPKKDYFRNMENPNLGNPAQPSTVAEIDATYDPRTCLPDSKNDGCGNHILSGIPNAVLTILAKKHTFVPLQNIVYRVMVDRLQAFSNFADYKLQLMDECQQQLGTHALCVDMKTAFENAGI